MANKPEVEIEVPREVIAMVVLHAILSGQSGIATAQRHVTGADILGSAKEYVDAAFVFADLMVERAKS